MKDKKLTNIICECIGLAMGISVVVLNLFGTLNDKTAFGMLGIGLFCTCLSLMSKETK